MASAVSVEKRGWGEAQGLDHGLTNYGDPDFARLPPPVLRQLDGHSRDLLDKPGRRHRHDPPGFNNHRSMPDLVEAVSRGVFAAGALSRPFPTIRWGRYSSIPPA